MYNGIFCYHRLGSMANSGPLYHITHIPLIWWRLHYFPYVEKLMPMIKYLSEKMGFNYNLIKLLCTFKEIPGKGKLYSTMFNTL